MAENVMKNISNTVSNASTSYGSLAGTRNDSSMVNASGEYLRSNNNVAKFAFFILILLIFVLLLNLGIMIMGYFMSATRNPYVVKGILDGKNSQVISQNPKDSNSVMISRSNNEKTGIEFSWSVWLLLKNNATDGKYKNVFNKGDSFYGAGVGFENPAGNGNGGISLVNNGPGLYLSSLVDGQNVLHVVMDSVDISSGPTIIDVDGVPFNKWFNVVIRVKNKIIDVYINGTISHRKIMDFVPKQNYNDINICQNGGFDGLLSNLQYYDSAISAPEINLMVVRGPSTVDSKMSTTLNSIMPYFLSSAWYSRK
jgi:Concanavalin A-like lectin/glucanases superfamily